MNSEANSMADQQAAIEGTADQSGVRRQTDDYLADSIRRASEGEAIAASYRKLPQGPEEDAAALANAIAMTEAGL